MKELHRTVTSCRSSGEYSLSGPNLWLIYLCRFISVCVTVSCAPKFSNFRHYFTWPTNYWKEIKQGIVKDRLWNSKLSSYVEKNDLACKNDTGCDSEQDHPLSSTVNCGCLVCPNLVVWLHLREQVNRLKFSYFSPYQRLETSSHLPTISCLGERRTTGQPFWWHTQYISRVERGSLNISNYNNE